jgi:nitrite reductase (NADH) small subunit
MFLAQWVRVCAVGESPKPGEATEAEAGGMAICLANIEGRLAALDNVCPHRQGPLGQGWVEGEAVVCPWHCWAFNTRTGVAEAPDVGAVRVFPVNVVDGDVLVNVE